MATTTRVLLLGGHGKVALHLTPLLLAKSWNVTSVIRNEEHKSEILSLGKDQPGQLDVLIESLDEVKTEADAKKVLDQVKPSWVVWSAGAGGKGGPERTKQIDEVAAKAYISASINTPSVSKFLMVSFIHSRRKDAPWWTPEDSEFSWSRNRGVLKNYYAAKVEADEHLAALAWKRNQSDPSFQAINLRPGILTADPATGKIMIGRITSQGKIPREDVARTAFALLSRNDTRGYYDECSGPTDIDTAIDGLVKERFDGIEGEDFDLIKARVQ